MTDPFRGVEMICKHDFLIHLTESPLWVCRECECEHTIAEWHRIKRFQRATTSDLLREMEPLLYSDAELNPEGTTP